MNIEGIKKALVAGDLDSNLARVYVTEEAVKAQRERYVSVVEDFAGMYEDGEISLFSSPGRTEVCGNHTDHNHGKVLAAAVNLDVIAACAKTDNNIIQIKSRGFAKTDKISLGNLIPVASEVGHSASLIRGVAARFKQLGYNIGGFNAATTSDVLSGSGLSSSAAFEVLVATILNYLYNDGKVSPVEIAQIAQYSENIFFGKPCGLMDQMACSVGGFVKIDFEDPANPIIEPIDFKLAEHNHSLCIVDTRAGHAELTEEYASIREDMESVAQNLGGSCLRQVDEEKFIANIAMLRQKTSDKAILRAMHFYAENKRVDKCAEYLRAGDIEGFKATILSSGASSYQYNQNVNSAIMGKSQPVGLALCISQSILENKGAWRVHGGGFAGTIQAFVPDDLLTNYKNAIESVFGENATYVLQIRSAGGAQIV
jgi:galactokinase